MCEINNKRAAVGISCISWMLLIVPMVATALTPVDRAPSGADAGSIQREVLQALPEGESQPVQIDIPSLPPLKEVSGLVVNVNQFTITGNTAFDSETLEALLGGDVGSKKSFSDLQSAARKISNYYREHGYPVARAYLPEQELDESGLVLIAIIEGVTGSVTIQGSEQLIDWVGEDYASVLNKGELVNSADLERSLLLLNDLPGVTAKASLKAGAIIGSTDVDITLDESTTATGFVSANNYGTDYSGNYRLTGGANVNNLIGIGDQFTGVVLNSESAYTNYGSLGYSMPVGPLGTRVGVSYSKVDSEVGAELRQLGIQNEADVWNINVTHPFIRSHNVNQVGKVSYISKNIEETWGADFVALDPTLGSEEGLSTFAFGVSGDWRDGYYGGGYNTYSLSGDIGTIDFDSVTASRLGAEDNYFKLNYDSSRLQRVDNDLTLYAHLRGQYSKDRLVVSEQKALGGPHGVRAFGVGEGLADQAVLLSVEARYNLNLDSDVIRDSMVYGFIDAGYGKVSDALVAIGTTPGTTDKYNLSGYGVGIKLGFGLDQGMSLNANVAWGSRNEDDTGSGDNEQFWAQFVKTFN
jgi:hemolysin activation/secretion protein